ncbi:MAG: flagellar hook-length control protein FliK [Eubacterium sp.]|nr:flagellar hook-length control protein FliK [Eubacterium sp.]
MPISSTGIQNNPDSLANNVATPQSRSYRNGNTTITLHQGETIRGVVSNIHGNEITLSMEDGSTFSGKLPDANQYSIGQKAAFQITNLEQNTIYMKAVSSAYLLDMEDTIDQALEEAALPKSDRNADVVRSLLTNQQSISRDNILAAIRLCAKYPNNDVNSVITMQRLGMPMNESNVNQFEKYQNHSHQLVNQMDDLADSVNKMMTSIGTQVPRLASRVGNEIINLALSASPTPEEAELARSQILNQPFPLDSEVEAEHPLNPFVDDPLADTEEAKLLSTNPEALDLGKEVTESASPFDRVKQLFSSLTDGQAAAKAAVAESGLMSDYKVPFIHEQVGYVLSPSERQQFANFLKDFPLPEDLRQAIIEGSISNRDLLTNLQKALPHMSQDQSGNLLASKAFQSIMKGQFMTNWTISPEHLKDPGAMEDLYRQISSQMDSLSRFSQEVLGRNVFSQLTDQANQMNENLDFMKLLNDNFQYVQLPVKLQNQEANGDLYVMTRKEALLKNPENLKVLLHLDMDHLGTLDIHISRDGNAVTTKFIVDKENTAALLEKNIELLQDAINEQGFAFSSEFSTQEKDIDIVKDFMSADAPVGSMSRYNFDLRA